MDETVKLTPLEIDALNEMGNVATGNAVTALSKMLQKPVDMNIPATKFIPVKDFSNEIGGPEKIVSCIYLQIVGDLAGEVTFIFPREGALELTDLVMGRPVGTTQVISDLDESAFKEVANILTGAFLTAMATMLDVRILPSIPHTATDMTQAVLDFILIKVSKYADNILCVKTKINVAGHHIDGDFLVVFDKESLRKMVDRLHKKYGDLS